MCDDSNRSETEKRTEWELETILMHETNIRFGKVENTPIYLSIINA